MWWNDEWLNGFDSELGNYPIVCRVERTHAEFPPDPFTKTVRKDDGGNVVKVSWEAPRDPRVTKRIAGTPLRLGTGLRPQIWSDAGPRGDVELSLVRVSKLFRLT